MLLETSGFIHDPLNRNLPLQNKYRDLNVGDWYYDPEHEKIVSKIFGSTLSLLHRQPSTLGKETCTIMKF